jgi:prefoldin subunit 5
MPYKNRIKTLEESVRLLDNQIFQLQKTGNTDTEKIKKLIETKDKYFTELRQMNRAQWDYDHETVNLDDDR